MTAVGTYRDFVELLKDMLEHLHPLGRPVTPMFHADVGDRLTTMLVDPTHFEESWPGADDRLIDGFIVPFVREHLPSMVGWTFTAHRWTRAIGADEYDLAMIVVIDRERHETWHAPVLSHRLGGWISWPPNMQQGRLITTIQETLR